MEFLLTICVLQWFLSFGLILNEYGKAAEAQSDWTKKKAARWLLVTIFFGWMFLVIVLGWGLKIVFKEAQLWSNDPWAD